MAFPLKNAIFSSAENKESVTLLIDTEEQCMVSAGYPDWGKDLRHRAIRMIHSRLNSDPELNENPYLPFLTLNLFDRVASLYEIFKILEGSALGNMIDSCIRLARKFQHASVLENISENEAESYLEEYVFTQLNGLVNPVTPLTYLDFLVKKLTHDITDPNRIIKQARVSISLAFFSTKVLKHKPSVIAICSVLAQIEKHHNFRELKESLLEDMGNVEDLRLLVDNCSSEVHFV